MPINSHFIVAQPDTHEYAGSSVRTLTLMQITKIHIPRKKTETQRPREDVLQLADGPATRATGLSCIMFSSCALRWG